MLGQPKSPRVLHLVSSSLFTGAADPALSLARAERSIGIDASIAFDTVRPENDLREKAKEYGVPVVASLALHNKGKFWRTLSDRRQLLRLASEVDVVHAHASHDHVLAAFARGPARLVRTIHHPRSCARRGLQPLVYGRTDGFIFVAEAHRAEMLAEHPRVSEERTAVIRSAVDLDRFHPDVDGSYLRETFRIPRDAFVIGIVSRIKPGRRHDLLLDAFRAARASEKKLHLVIIGRGEGEAALRTRVAALASSDCISFYGYRDRDLPHAIRSCNATVLLAEGNDAGCRAVLQSLAMGVPVIGARHAAIEDAIGDDVCGVLVPPDDRDALAAAMIALARASCVELAALSRTARARMHERHTERRHADAVLSFYRALLERSGVG